MGSGRRPKGALRAQLEAKVARTQQLETSTTTGRQGPIGGAKGLLAPRPKLLPGWWTWRTHREHSILISPPFRRVFRPIPSRAGRVARVIGLRLSPTPSPHTSPSHASRYKWIALSNTTLAVLLATLDASITLIAMPDIFRGIKLDPLVPANSFYLLWMILGYLVVSSVLIVSLGRLGDMFGRVRIYNLGFVIYTIASLLLAIDWMEGRAGADYLIVFRIVQGVGGACLLANAAAIITDAFPVNQRGMALGINNIVGVSGMFVGLILGGLLAPIDWRLVFLISVPVGLFGTVWGYLKLEERSQPKRASIDWWGNATFAAGLVLVMVAVTYGIRPYGGHATGWTSPRVLALLGAAAVSLTAFVAIERARGGSNVQPGLVSY